MMRPHSAGSAIHRYSLSSSPTNGGRFSHLLPSVRKIVLLTVYVGGFPATWVFTGRFGAGSLLWPSDTPFWLAARAGHAACGRALSSGGGCDTSPWHSRGLCFSEKVVCVPPSRPSLVAESKTQISAGLGNNFSTRSVSNLLRVFSFLYFLYFHLAPIDAHALRATLVPAQRRPKVSKRRRSPACRSGACETERSLSTARCGRRPA